MPDNRQKTDTCPPPCKTQLYIEKVLLTGAWALALCHMVLSLGRYLFNYFTTVRPVECWYALALITLSLIYLVLTPFLWKGTGYRIRNFLKKFRSPDQIFCLVLFFWYILVCLINEAGSDYPVFLYNDWWILDTAVNCVLLFSLPKLFPKEKARRFIDWLLHVPALFWTVFSVYGLWCLFTLNVVTMPSGAPIGMSADNIFFLACDPNITAANALSLILICFYMFATQKLPVKILYGFSLAVHTLVLLLTNSRAGFVGCLAAYAIGLFLLMWNLNKERSISARILLSAAVPGAAAAVLFVMRTLVFELFESITHFSERIAGQANNAADLIKTRALIPMKAGLVPFFCLKGEKARKAAEILLHVIAILGTVPVLFTLISLPAAAPGTESPHEVSGRLINAAACAAVMVIGVSIYMAAARKGIVRIVYLIGAAVHLFALLLMNSRAGFIAAAAICASGSVLLIGYFLKHQNAALRLVLQLAVPAAVLLLLWGLRSAVLQTFPGITAYAGTQAEQAAYDSTITNTWGKSGGDAVRKLSNFGARQPVWNAAFKVMTSDLKTFLFGVTPVFVPHSLYTTGGYPYEEIAHAHNQLLQMGVSLGVPMMTAFLWFLISIGLKCLRLGLTEGGRHFPGDFMLPNVFGTLVVLTLVEAYLFGYFCIMSSLFFLFCGWISTLAGTGTDAAGENHD